MLCCQCHNYYNYADGTEANFFEIRLSDCIDRDYPITRLEVVAVVRWQWALTTTRERR